MSENAESSNKEIVAYAKSKKDIGKINNDTMLEKVFNWIKILTTISTFVIVIIVLIVVIMKYLFEMDISSIRILLEAIFYHLLSIGIGSFICVVIHTLSLKSVKK